LCSLQERKKRTIDYSAEVAFEKKPAAGFFDTSEEQFRSKEIQQASRGWGMGSRGRGWVKQQARKGCS
jgi:hypothetical protein